MKFHLPLVTTLLLLLLASPAQLPAEESVRECIEFAGSGQVFALPADQVWHTIGNLKFNIADESDIIVTAGLFYAENNPANQQITYRITLDGQRRSLNFIHRTAEGFWDTLDIRTLISDVNATGDHVLTVDALNQTGSTVYYRGFWLSPHMIDSDEISVKDVFNTGPPITVGSTWTTVADITLNPGSAKSLYVGGFVEAGGGTAGKRLDYRFFLSSHNTELRRFADTVPGFPDGSHIAYILEVPPSGSNTVQLQVRAPNGDLMDIKRASLFAHVMPQYTVFTGGAFGTTIPSDGNWYPVGQSANELVKSISRGDMGTWGTGFGHTTMIGALSGATQWCFDILQNNSPLGFDVGCHQLHADGKTQLKTTMSDWGGRVGLNGTDQYAIRLKAKSLCTSSPHSLSLAGTDFQVAVVPSNSGLIAATCPIGTSWANCCTSPTYGQNCTYECSGNSALLISTSGLPSFNLDPCN